MRETVKLELNFGDEEGRNKKLTIQQPVLALTEAEVRPVMETIIASDIFDADGFDPYASAKNARYIRTEVDEIYAATEA